MKQNNLIWAIIRSLRPRQWIKNFALFGGLIFSGQLDTTAVDITILNAFLLFCLASSATYLINDIVDIERDRLHPFKKNRPIAAGILPVSLAAAIAGILVFLAVSLAFYLSLPFFLSIVGYLILQLFYSLYLKTTILLDVMAIAAGFVLRIYAGIWVINAHVNVWFLLTVISFALFLAIGKRRSELTLLQAKAAQHRETLHHYPESLLDSLTTMFANSTWLSYALFAFLQPPIHARPRLVWLLNGLNLPFTNAKYLMVTIPIVIYGVMRYLYAIYEKKEGESPERVLLTDTPLLASVVLWLIVVLTIIYYLGA